MARLSGSRIKPQQRRGNAQHSSGRKGRRPLNKPSTTTQSSTVGDIGRLLACGGGTPYVGYLRLVLLLSNIAFHLLADPFIFARPK